jgi:hypothetical protein
VDLGEQQSPNNNTSRSAKFSELQKAMLQMYHFNMFFFKFKSNLPAKNTFFSFKEAAFNTVILDLIYCKAEYSIVESFISDNAE